MLFLSHFVTPAVTAEFRRLVDELGTSCDVRFAYDATRVTGVPPTPAEGRTWTFTQADLFDLPYPLKCAARRLNPGHVDLALLHYFRHHPPAPWYWLIEHDVRFSGPWPVLFDVARRSRADLLGTTLRRHRDAPDWRFWYTLVPPPGEVLPPEAMLRGFFPIVRLSHGALVALDAAYQAGWGGHWEGTVPTILSRAGLTIEDLGGDGEFVPAGARNRFYTNTPSDPLLAPGSFVFRPVREAAGETPNRLWHPVKAPTDPTWRFRPWRDWWARVRTARLRRRHVRHHAATTTADRTV